MSRVKVNKHGQTLGRKGAETRARLIGAAGRLLAETPPAELTAIAVAKEAGIAQASFYVYFNDVKDLLYALCVEATAEMAALHGVLNATWDRRNPVAFARRIVETYHDIWDRHRPLFNYRNAQGDDGDRRFYDLRFKQALPIQDGLCALILASYPPDRTPRRSIAYAEATVLNAAIERIAALDPALLESGLGIRRLKEAEIRILARAIAPHDLSDPVTLTQEPGRAPRRP